MKPTTPIGTAPWGKWLVWSSAALLGLLSGGSTPTPLGAQSRPPVQGTVALEGTMKQFYRAANTIIVTTIDGMEHVYHFTRDLVVHGGKGSGVDALQGLREGATVVIHYTVDGADQSAREIDRVGGEGLKTAEGIVTRVDRGHEQITIRFDNGKTETLRLTDRAAEETRGDFEPGTTGGGKVIVYYSDETGQKVAHFFRKTS
jgi:hypothetical protein